METPKAGGVYQTLRGGASCGRFLAGSVHLQAVRGRLRRRPIAGYAAKVRGIAEAERPACAASHERSRRTAGQLTLERQVRRVPGLRRYPDVVRRDQSAGLRHRPGDARPGALALRAVEHAARCTASRTCPATEDGLEVRHASRQMQRGIPPLREAAPGSRRPDPGESMKAPDCSASSSLRSAVIPAQCFSAAQASR